MFPFLIIIVIDIIIIIINDCECQVRLLWNNLAAFHCSVYANCTPLSHLLYLSQTADLACGLFAIVTAAKLLSHFSRVRLCVTP